MPFFAAARSLCQRHTMWRSGLAAFGVLLALGCSGDSGRIAGVTAECTLVPIVDARLARGAVDCSPERLAGSAALQQAEAMARVDEPAAIQCIQLALAAGHGAVYLFDLVFGTDSRVQVAKFFYANGETVRLTYDSSPSGQGTGSNTVSLNACAPFSLVQDLYCQDEGPSEIVCSHDEELGARVR